MSVDILLVLLFSTITMATPLIIAALGGLYSERSGVVNIGLEGMMTIGAFAAASTMAGLDDFGMVSFLAGLLAAMLAAGIFGLIHGVLTITFKIDQIISGVSINIIAAAVALYLTEVIYASGETPSLYNTGIEFFGKINIITVIAVILVFATGFIINKTVWGLRLRSVGENPQASDAMGINVIKVRYQAVIVSAILAGIGGMAIVVTTSENFSATVVAGKGFIALAVLIFGRWNPKGVLLASIFFGFTSALGTISTVVFPNLNIDKNVFIILPYVITIIALIIFSRKMVQPKALGSAYDKEKR